MAAFLRKAILQFQVIILISCLKRIVTTYKYIESISPGRLYQDQDKLFDMISKVQYFVGFFSGTEIYFNISSANFCQQFAFLSENVYYEKNFYPFRILTFHCHIFFQLCKAKCFSN